MRQKSVSQKPSSERLVKNIRRATRKQYSAEEKIRIVLDGLRGEHSIAKLCRREGIVESQYYSWSKEFLEAGKRAPKPSPKMASNSEIFFAVRRSTESRPKVLREFRFSVLGAGKAPNFSDFRCIFRCY